MQNSISTQLLNLEYLHLVSTDSQNINRNEKGQILSNLLTDTATTTVTVRNSSVIIKGAVCVSKRVKERAGGG